MDDEMMQLIANTLSMLTILSSLFLKVPQIMYIIEKESAEGIFVQALLMEVTGFSIMTLYNYTSNYSIMTYMEYPIILFQVYVMFYFVLKYKKLLPRPEVPILTIAYIGTVVGFMMDALPKSILSFLVPFCTPLSGFAKVTYIYGIICAANADAVSLTTWVISVATNLTRIFTVFVDSADQKLMANFAISTLLSTGVLVTALYYKQKGPSTARSHRKPANATRRRHSHDD